MTRKPRKNSVNFWYNNRYTLISLVIIIGMFAGVQARYDPGVQVIKSFLSPRAVLTGERTVALGGPFALVDGQGRPFTEQNLLGRYSLIFFGYTFCPDVCPTTLGRLTQVYEALSPAERAQLQVVMVSVDPQRDTPTVMGEYVTAFHPDFIGLTGTPEQVATIADAYKVFYKKQPGETADTYGMDHSSYIYLMAPDGHYLKHFDWEDTPDTIKKDLRTALHK